MVNAVSDRNLSKSFVYLAGALCPIVCVVILVVWLVQAVSWDPEWYNPFRESSFMTLVLQWLSPSSSPLRSTERSIRRQKASSLILTQRNSLLFLTRLWNRCNARR